MFTGLVQDMGTVTGISRQGELVRLSIRPSTLMEDLKVGESVAVDGVCLTVVKLTEWGFDVEVSVETLRRTTLGELSPSRKVNLERALRPMDRMGGHIVSGHVDAVGVIERKATRNRYMEFRIGAEESLDRYIVEKGSVAVDGVSLTVNSCGRGWFELMLIPHTIAHTTLSQKGDGDKVNVECDILGKYVEKLLAPWTEKGNRIQQQQLTMERLKELGFL